VRGDVLHIYGIVGIHEFNYGTHIVEAICTLANSSVHAVRFIGENQIKGQICRRYTLHFNSGVTAEYSITPGLVQPFVLVVITSVSTYTLQIDTERIYGALLDEICTHMETGSSKLIPAKDLTHPIRSLLAAKQSRISGGKPVMLTDIAPTINFDGADFTNSYAKSAPPVV
jgi:hypothetical protein